MSKIRNSNIQNPHDIFVGSLLRQKAEAISFMKGAFPVDLKEAVNYDSLILSPETYLTPAMRKSYSDIVYSGYYNNSNRSHPNRKNFF